MNDSTAAQSPRPRVALVFGGRSSEHPVSCATAASVMEAIDTDRWDVLPIGITRQGQWVVSTAEPESLEIGAGHIPEVTGGAESVVVPLGQRPGEVQVLSEGLPPEPLGQVDVVFPLLHGPFGEDGTLQGMLELADVRYVGCGVTSSALMMDKHHMKRVFEQAGLEVGPYTVITDRRWRHQQQEVLEEARGLQLPIFVKPCRAGSSMGITRVDSYEDLPAAIEAAREHDLKVVLEEGVDGRELECAVLDGHHGEMPRASTVGEIVVSGGHGFYDFEAKYLDEQSTRLSAPADAPEHVIERIRELAVQAFLAADCEGLARVDFFVTPDERILVNEINTMPGFTPYSMYPALWAASGIEYSELIDELLTLAMERPLGLR
ncbi:D-alanine-D-alanine ligase [Kytococcus aerolatus]|uniref:D-alanine--D-alanine ligase n=1 Tax=Kytococcus aerolatus TaxID=592308 RepID=A0A212U1W0_9MICO|nr:D-alanine--D-alanine ligase family protein [Kytococcus aerolatus]SNC72116.1 D-alanine-D-alanine ligase [Kytococcus aerolatus]